VQELPRHHGVSRALRRRSGRADGAHHRAQYGGGDRAHEINRPSRSISVDGRRPFGYLPSVAGTKTLAALLTVAMLLTGQAARPANTRCARTAAAQA